MKTYHNTGGHIGEIRENGIVIDSALGRNAIHKMRVRHGLIREDGSPRKSDGGDNLPTGLNSHPAFTMHRLSESEWDIIYTPKGSKSPTLDAHARFEGGEWMLDVFAYGKRTDKAHIESASFDASKFVEIFDYILAL